MVTSTHNGTILCASGGFNTAILLKINLIDRKAVIATLIQCIL
jgi:hypothetical protein